MVASSVIRKCIPIFGYDITIADAQTAQDLTPLQAAIKQNNTILVIELLKCGMDVNTPCADDGKTAFITACEKGTFAMIQLLQCKGNADINLTCNRGLNPLRYVFSNPKINTDNNILTSAIEWFADKGSDTNCKDNEGQSLLAFCVENSFTETIIAKILQLGADPNIADNTGLAPVVIAAKKLPQTEAVFKLLLQHGTNVNQSDINGKTLFQIVTEKQNINLAKLLFTNGAYVQFMGKTVCITDIIQEALKDNYVAQDTAGQNAMKIIDISSIMEGLTKWHEVCLKDHSEPWINLEDIQRNEDITSETGNNNGFASNVTLRLWYATSKEEETQDPADEPSYAVDDCYVCGIEDYVSTEDLDIEQEGNVKSSYHQLYSYDSTDHSCITHEDYEQDKTITNLMDAQVSGCEHEVENCLSTDGNESSCKGIHQSGYESKATEISSTSDDVFLQPTDTPATEKAKIAIGAAVGQYPHAFPSKEVQDSFGKSINIHEVTRKTVKNAAKTIYRRCIPLGRKVTNSGISGNRRKYSYPKATRKITDISITKLLDIFERLELTMDHIVSLADRSCMNYGNSNMPDSLGITSLNDDAMLEIAKYIGHGWKLFGMELGFAMSQLEHIESDNRFSNYDAIHKMLCSWANKEFNATNVALEDIFVDALKKCNMADLAKIIETDLNCAEPLDVETPNS